MKTLRWLLGDNPWRAPAEGSAGLLVVLCAAAALGMGLGDTYPLKGDPVVNGVYRMHLHGLLPLAALGLWAALRSGAARGVASLGLLAALVPVALRYTADKRVFTDPTWLVASAVLTAGCALLAGARAGEPARGWGLGLGDWRWWGPRALVVLAVLVPGCIAAVLLDPALQDFYPLGKLAKRGWPQFAWMHLGLLLDFIGWELLFRGTLLFGVYRRGDPWVAVFLPVLPFFLLHAGRPDLELALSFVGGALTGWFVLRARSMLPALVLHWVQITVVGATALWLRG